MAQNNKVSHSFYSIFQEFKKKVVSDSFFCCKLLTGFNNSPGIRANFPGYKPGFVLWKKNGGLGKLKF